MEEHPKYRLVVSQNKSDRVQSYSHSDRWLRDRWLRDRRDSDGVIFSKSCRTDLPNRNRYRVDDSARRNRSRLMAIPSVIAAKKMYFLYSWIARKV